MTTASPITPLDYTSVPGIPYQWNQDVNVLPEGLSTGDSPTRFTQDLPFAPSQVILARTPLMFNANKQLVPAQPYVPANGETPASGGVAIGFALIDIVVGTSSISAPVVRSGCYNPNLLNWDDSFTTTAQKMGAFEGAPTPTHIILRAPSTASVTLP